MSTFADVLSDDEYRTFVDKYSNVRNDFEARMTEACKVRWRLKRMETCGRIFSWNLQNLSQYCRESCLDLFFQKHLMAYIFRITYY